MRRRTYEVVRIRDIIKIRIARDSRVRVLSVRCLSSFDLVSRVLTIMNTKKAVYGAAFYRAWEET